MKEVKNEKKGKKNNKIHLIIILVAVIVVAVIAVFYFKENKSNTSKSTSKSSSSQSSDKDVANSMPNSLIDMNNTDNAKVSYNKKENTSSTLSKEKTYKNMTVKDIQLVATDGITKFTATVENNSGADFEGGEITIKFTKEDGSEYDTLSTLIPSIKNGETGEIQAKSTADLVNAYDFTISE